MSSARAYGPVAGERPRDPLIAEWLVRLSLALALFAGCFALGRATAPAPSGEVAPPARIAASPAAAVVPRQLSGEFPLERALQERAAAEREELARAAAAAARAKKRAGQGSGGAHAARANPSAGAPVLTQAPAVQPRAQPSAPVTRTAAPAPPPRPTGSSGSGGSFESSG